MNRRLSRAQYGCLVKLRNGLGELWTVPDQTTESLRRRGLIKQYDLEITRKGHQLMDWYSATSRTVS